MDIRCAFSFVVCPWKTYGLDQWPERHLIHITKRDSQWLSGHIIYTAFAQWDKRTNFYSSAFSDQKNIIITWLSVTFQTYHLHCISTVQWDKKLWLQEFCVHLLFSDQKFFMLSAILTTFHNGVKISCEPSRILVTILKNSVLICVFLIKKVKTYH